MRGPDGIVYPDCRFAGLSSPPTSVFDRHYRIDRSTFVGTDISGRLRELLTEIHALADRTDGDRPAVLIEIDAGTYYLSEITTLAQEHIVIRGAGSGLTELVFQCLDPRSPEDADSEYVNFAWPGNGRRHRTTAAHVYAANAIDVEARPQQLDALELHASIDGSAWVGLGRSPGDSAKHDLSKDAQPTRKVLENITGAQIASALGVTPSQSGVPVVLRASANYVEGDTARTRAVTKQILLKSGPEPTGLRAHTPTTPMTSVFNVIGPGEIQTGRVGLLSPVSRGDTSITLNRGVHWPAGQLLVVKTPDTPTFFHRIGQKQVAWRASAELPFRFVIVEVAAPTRGSSTVLLTQPMRDVYPVTEAISAENPDAIATVVYPVATARRVGFEGFTLNIGPSWLGGFGFKYVSQTWIKDVRILHASRRGPLWFQYASHCLVDGVRAEHAQWQGGAGAYFGGDMMYDTLLQNLYTYDLRHAPNLQQSSSGNVVRDGTFVSSDMQLHSHWTHDNIFENLKVIHNYKQDNRDDGYYSSNANGGYDRAYDERTYGYAFWGSPESDRNHGPQGDYMVLYRCDGSSDKAGALLGGVGANWRIVYNRFIVDHGHGLHLADQAEGFVIRHNAFSVARRPLIEGTERLGIYVQADAARTGSYDVAHNIFSGFDAIVGGGTGSQGAVLTDNLMPATAVFTQRNTDFQSVPDGADWLVEGKANYLELHGQDPLDGAFKQTSRTSLRFHDTGIARSERVVLKSQPQPVRSAGYVYQVRFWSKVFAASNLSASFAVTRITFFRDEAGTEALANQPDPEVIDAREPGNWITQVVQAEAPQGARSFRFSVETAEASTCDFLLDETVFAEGLPLPALPAGVPSSLSDWQRNVLTNGDFKQDLAEGWQASTHATRTEEVLILAKAGQTAVSALCPAAPAAPHVLRYRSHSPAVGGEIWLEFFDSANAAIGAPKRLTIPADPTGWRDHIVRFGTPANTAGLRLTAAIQTDARAALQLDDIILARDY